MISFKQFINEGPKGTGTFERESVDIPALLNFIETECSDYLNAWSKNKTVPIFRGEAGFKGLATIGNSDNFKRTSANTKSWYNQFIDSSPEWAGYPKRLSSYICTTDIKLAEGYGRTLAVFPSNKTLIGICPKEDMFVCFSEIEKITGSRFDGVSEIQTWVERILKTMKLYKSVPTDDSALVNFFAEISKDDIIKTVKDVDDDGYMADSQSIDKIATYMNNNNLNNLAEFYWKVFTPTDFKKCNPASLPLINEDVEIWISGKCAFLDINEAFYNEDRHENKKLMDDFAKKHNVIWNS